MYYTINITGILPVFVQLQNTLNVSVTYINKNNAVELDLELQTINRISTIVFNYYKLPIDMINNKTKKREIVKARQICHWYLKEYTKISLSKIAKNIGNKDHSTVLSSYKTVQNDIDTNRQYENEILEIKTLIKILQ